jgi:hypothetical protein
MLKMTPKGMPRRSQKVSKIIKNHEKSWPRRLWGSPGYSLRKNIKKT